MSSPLVPQPVRRALPLLSLLTAGWMLGWALAVEGTQGPLGVDRAVDRHLGWVKGVWLHAANALASLGQPWRFAGLAVAVAAVFVGVRAYGAVVVFALSLLVELLAVEVVLKPLVDRHGAFASGQTFPSGHTATAGVVATVVVLLARPGAPLGRRLRARGRVTVTALALVSVPAVGMAMVANGAHQLSDVLAAAPLGVTVTLLVATGVDRWGGPLVGRIEPVVRRLRRLERFGRTAGSP